MITYIRYALKNCSSTAFLIRIFANLGFLRKIWPHLNKYTWQPQGKSAIHNAPSNYSPTLGDIDNLMDYHKYQLSILRKIGLKTEDLSRKIVLEIGPGNSLGLAALMCKLGAQKVYAIDVSNFVNWTLTKGVFKKLKVDPRNVTYISNAPVENIPLPSSSVDIVYSFAVLEHVRDPQKAIAEIYRVLRNRGKTIHFIDLKDHIWKEPLGFLKIPPCLWKLNYVTNSVGPYTNRLRAKHWKLLFKKCGFVLEKFKALELINDEYVQKVKKGLTKPFKDMNIDDLKITHLGIAARK